MHNLTRSFTLLAAGAFLTFCASMSATAGAAPPAGDDVTPEAKAQTEPVPHGGDADDDLAIWLHPTDPAKTLILGTDKQGGLHVYDLETVGIWPFPAEPDGGERGELVAKVGEHGLTADVKGLTMYGAAGGKGYLIASSRGSNTFLVYARQDSNRYLLTIDPKGGRIDDVNDTDGIAVINCATSKQFPAGFLVVQDGSTPGGRQNFKLYDWRDIAGTRLLIDTAWNPRGGPKEEPEK